MHRSLPSSFSARRAALAVATVLSLTLAGGALASPGGPGPGGPGFGGPGGHHGGFGGAPLEHVIAEARTKLNLNTSQQLQFDQAVANARAAREQGRGIGQTVRDAARAELAKPEPDLAGIARTADEAQAKGQALRKQVRDEFLKLYGTFSAEQKAVVRDLLKSRMDRAESFREKMRERMQQRGGQGG
jgi:Spy/CpxP family protein refolding chaperone